MQKLHHALLNESQGAAAEVQEARSRVASKTSTTTTASATTAAATFSSSSSSSSSNSSSSSSSANDKVFMLLYIPLYPSSPSPLPAS